MRSSLLQELMSFQVLHSLWLGEPRSQLETFSVPIRDHLWAINGTLVLVSWKVITWQLISYHRKCEDGHMSKFCTHHFIYQPRSSELCQWVPRDPQGHVDQQINFDWPLSDITAVQLLADARYFSNRTSTKDLEPLMWGRINTLPNCNWGLILPADSNCCNIQ